MLRQKQPIGVVLAGGLGHRMGGSKLTVKLHGRPLLSYPLDALKEALDEVHVITKPDIMLPDLPGATVWIEPESPRHPLVGIVEALALADGRAVVVCPVDLPFVTPALIRRLVRAKRNGAPAVVAASEGVMQPLLGCYQHEAARLLADAARIGEAPVREAVAAIGPRLLEVGDPDTLFNVNSPDDLLLAAAMLDRVRYPKVKS
jgi:molybdopterin-guanine dinucleotide biosynthesis protein A